MNYANESDYLDSVVQTVSHARPGVGWNAHAFGRCDVAQLQRQYDVTTTTRISTCLDAIPTMLAFSTSASAVGWDGSARLTARLRIDDDPTVTFRLRGNDLDGRTVVLQRRPPGGTWTDAQVLSATDARAAQSAVTLRLRSTTEFRAVFRKPSDEPLLATTSGTVRVTVNGGCSLPPCPQAMPVPGRTLTMPRRAASLPIIAPLAFLALLAGCGRRELLPSIPTPEPTTPVPPAA